MGCWNDIVFFSLKARFQGVILENRCPWSFNPISYVRQFRTWKNITNYNAVILTHYNDGIMRAMASQITCLTIVYSTVYSGADQRKHQSSASPVTGELPAQMFSNAKMFPFYDVIMRVQLFYGCEKNIVEPWHYRDVKWGSWRHIYPMTR